MDPRVRTPHDGSQLGLGRLHPGMGARPRIGVVEPRFADFGNLRVAAPQPRPAVGAAHAHLHGPPVWVLQGDATDVLSDGQCLWFHVANIGTYAREVKRQTSLFLASVLASEP